MKPGAERQRLKANFLGVACLEVSLLISEILRFSSGASVPRNTGRILPVHQSALLLGGDYRTCPISVSQVVGLQKSRAPKVPLVELTISQAQSAFLAGDLNCSDLVGAYLQRIRQYDAATQLNSVRVLAPDVVQRAQEKDAELLDILKRSAPLPSLFCVPVLVKDNYDLVGTASTAGSLGLKDNYPVKNARQVDLLLQKGAVILGKTNMGEFALSPDESVGSMFGIVRNPYNLDYSTAGSSGGSSAAVSASLSMVALGTDTGNSIRGPASHCGVVGLRPSLGLTSRAGVVPARRNRDTTGPITRTVADAALMLEAMAGYDPADNLTALALQTVQGGPVGGTNYSQYLDAEGLQGACVGVFRQISNAPGVSLQVLELFDQAIANMADAGAVIVDNFTIQGNSFGLDWDANLGGKGQAYGHWNVNGVWENLWACTAALPYDLDNYLRQGNTTSTYKSLKDIYLAGDYHPSVASDLADALSQNYTPAQYPPPRLREVGYRCGCLDFFTDPCRLEFRRRLVESMDKQEVDVIVYPTWNAPPHLIGDFSKPDGNNSPDIAPHTGAPALTVPMGFTLDGLPTGLQLLARPFQEGTLLRIAFAYEQETMHRRPPPLFPELVDVIPSPNSGVNWPEVSG